MPNAFFNIPSTIEIFRNEVPITTNIGSNDNRKNTIIKNIGCE
ncbi:hypothetical protein ECPA39_5004, partial [Escherichia coli PA39]